MFKCLKSLEKLFVVQGLDYLCDYVEEKNIPSVNLLEKLGFKRFYITGYKMPGFIVDEKTGESWYIFLYKKYISGE
jgi:ribosomal protein S18 acetylase RimI-like enzyme